MTKATLYSLIAAAIVTAFFALVYASAKSQMVTLAAGGEGTAEEIRRVVNTVNISRVMLFAAGFIMLMMFTRFIILKRSSVRQNGVCG
jgi:hypothetical protein